MDVNADTIIALDTELERIGDVSYALRQHLRLDPNSIGGIPIWQQGAYDLQELLSSTVHTEKLLYNQLLPDSPIPASASEAAVPASKTPAPPASPQQATRQAPHTITPYMRQGPEEQDVVLLNRRIAILERVVHVLQKKLLMLAATPDKKNKDSASRTGQLLLLKQDIQLVEEDIRRKQEMVAGLKYSAPRQAYTDVKVKPKILVFADDGTVSRSDPNESGLDRLAVSPIKAADDGRGSVLSPAFSIMLRKMNQQMSSAERKPSSTGTELQPSPLTKNMDKRQYTQSSLDDEFYFKSSYSQAGGDLRLSEDSPLTSKDFLAMGQ
eukprot:ANDGO_06336.mRNA.1 hypothetical protein